eukprot:TRINITY_DN1503_c0_g1_i1.p1 TRINITY_DN1503_c0_g1~~TRINITY_DN1503_c0_g1_i1.p1  ORF type:complete len:235 (+),score=65.90 TRINITY_DN1503_c0_g1_i1:132-836(+)
MGERYSFSLTTFSPSGKLVQIEYALEAVMRGAPAIAIKATNGVVLVTEKKLPSLMDETSIHKIANITANIGVVYSGMGPDFRVLLSKGRKAAQSYNRKYRDHIPVEQLVRELASIMQDFTQSGGVRPFGVSLLVGGVDEQEGAQLYQVDPSGSYWAWKAAAIGKHMVSGRTFLEKRYKEDMDIEDAIHTAILTLKEGFEGQMSEKNIEIGIVGKEGEFRLLDESEKKDYLAEIE